MSRVTLHRFKSDQTLQQRDGVNLAHTEINHLISQLESNDLHVTFHDFARLLEDETYAYRTLSKTDCVLSNVGPHAHYYHWLRERFCLSYRIIRDIKTALWSSYLLQESLCGPLLRQGDALMATSNYSRKLTRLLFPHLIDHPISVFEPVLTMEEFIPQTTPLAKGGPITLGYVGRLSTDKNVPQMVELLLDLHRAEPGRYRLITCGSVHSLECEPNALAQKINYETGREDLFAYIPPMENSKIQDLIHSFDYFLFFSTSNLESLGRVLVECAYTGTPILAASHGAAPELLDGSSLLPVTYRLDEPFYSHFDCPLGNVNIEAAASKIRSGRRPQAPPQPTINRASVLLDLIQGISLELSGKGEDPVLHTDSTDFLNRLRWDNMLSWHTVKDACNSIESLNLWFCSLNGSQSANYQTYLNQLRIVSKFPERTERFARTAADTLGDFTNIGGIDIELCNIARFHPRFWLSADSRERGLD